MAGYDDLALPTDTLQLLADFTAEKDARAKAFEDLKMDVDSTADHKDIDGKLSMDFFGEDWNASQFW